MRVPKIIILFWFIFIYCPVFTAPYDMIPAGDPVLDDLRYIITESGHTFLSFTPPLSPGEIQRFLDSIDVSSLSRPAADTYYRIKNRVNPKTRIGFTHDIFSFQMNANANLEGRVRFNDDISWYPEHSKVLPMISIPFRFHFVNSFQLYFEPFFQIDSTYFNNNKYFSSNLLMNIEQIEGTVPFRAFGAAGNSWLNFQIGRDRLSFGTGESGNLAISDNPPYYDFARFSVFSKYFKYSALVSQMPLAITDAIYENVQTLKDENKLMRTMHRYLYMHRIDINLFERVSFGISEGVIAGNSAPELRYLNPLMIFHSFFSFWDYPQWDAGTTAPPGTGDMNGSLFSLELNWNIIKSLSVYGQFVMNQYALGFERRNWPDQVPNGLGYMAGARYSHSFKKWGSLFYFEFIYTDPYLYLNPSPFASLIHMQTLGYSPNRYIYTFIGYPRDTIACSLGARFFNGDYLVVNGIFTWQSRGEHGIKWDWKKTKEAGEERTPSGIAENKYIIGADVEWKVLPFLTLGGSLTGIFALNNNNVFGENTAGGQFDFSVRFSY